jgi:hypothetical protein
MVYNTYIHWGFRLCPSSGFRCSFVLIGFRLESHGFTPQMAPAVGTVFSSSSRQGGRPISINQQLSDSNKNLVISPRWGLDTKKDWAIDRRS